MSSDFTMAANNKTMKAVTQIQPTIHCINHKSGLIPSTVMIVTVQETLLANFRGSKKKCYSADFYLFIESQISAEIVESAVIFIPLSRRILL